MADTKRPMTFNDLSKEAVARRQPGRENKPCPVTNVIVRDCMCPKHLGARNRRKGKRTQREVRRQAEKAFGVPAGPSMAATANEETWRLPVRIEVKSGGQAKTVGTFYRNTRSQADLSKANGDIRPFMAVASVDGERDGLAVIRMSDLEQLVRETRR